MHRFNALVFIFLISCSALRAQIVNTQYGPVQGAQNGSVIQFLGIPFAKPPVDSLRWRAPQAPDSWTNALNTTAFKPECAQKQFSQLNSAGTVKGSEDCLYLNVWTPQTGAGNRPVMVFIHGGGNQQGSASETAGGTPLYFGKNIASRGEVVVVTIQYRLGALGFLAHPGLEAESAAGKSGNYAVSDQIMALQWVKNNIHLFGGDTSNITIFGESAGGVNVGNLMLTEQARGLFHRAIIQSAAPVMSIYSSERNKGVQFVNTFQGATGTDVQKIAYMRALHADSITVKYTSPLSAGLLQQNFQPTMDGILFTRFPTQAIESGNYNAVHVIIGSNGDEMSMNAPAVVTPAMVTALVNTNVPAAYRNQVIALYPPGNNNTQARKAYVDILSDAQFNAPVRRTARCLSLNQAEPVWNYFFTHAHTFPQFEPYGAYHGIELLYVFNTLENSQFATGQLFQPADDSVQRITRTYWTNFAHTGNPNGNGLVEWAEFEAGADCYLEIKAQPDNTLCKLREQKLDLWDAISGFTACQPLPNSIRHDAEVSVKIYPNPSPGIFRLELPDATGMRWRVFDLTGRTLLSGSNEFIDVSGYPSGSYVIKIETPGEVRYARLVKE